MHLRSRIDSLSFHTTVEWVRPVFERRVFVVIVVFVVCFFAASLDAGRQSCETKAFPVALRSQVSFERPAYHVTILTPRVRLGVSCFVRFLIAFCAVYRAVKYLCGILAAYTKCTEESSKQWSGMLSKLRFKIEYYISFLPLNFRLSFLLTPN